MARVADVRLHWKKSPSPDVQRVQVVTTINGVENTVDVGSEVEELFITLNANSDVHFKVVTFDDEGLFSSSTTYSFRIGDLEDPLPATDLGHEVMAIREVENGEDEPSPEGTTRVRKQEQRK